MSPSRRTPTILDIISVALLRLQLISSAGEKTIGEFFGAIVREYYIDLTILSVYLKVADFNADLNYILL